MQGCRGPYPLQSLTPGQPRPPRPGPTTATSVCPAPLPDVPQGELLEPLLTFLGLQDAWKEGPVLETVLSPCCFRGIIACIPQQKAQWETKG